VRSEPTCLICASFEATNLENADSARRCRFRNSQQKRTSDLDPTYVWIPKLDVVGGLLGNVDRLVVIPRIFAPWRGFVKFLPIQLSRRHRLLGMGTSRRLRAASMLVARLARCGNSENCCSPPLFKRNDHEQVRLHGHGFVPDAAERNSENLCPLVLFREIPLGSISLPYRSARITFSASAFGKSFVAVSEYPPIPASGWLGGYVGVDSKTTG
jgi:hypothetical protein